MSDPLPTVLDVLERIGVRAGSPQVREGLARKAIREGMTEDDAEIFYQWFHLQTRTSDPDTVAGRAATHLQEGTWPALVKDARKTMKDSIPGRRRSRRNQAERNQMRPEFESELPPTTPERMDQERAILAQLFGDRRTVLQVSEMTSETPDAIRAILKDPRHDGFDPAGRKARDLWLERQNRPGPRTWPPKG